MSTARKVLLTIATALVVAGITLAGTAFALAGGDLDEESVVYRGEALEEVLGIQQEHGWVE